jgi:integrase
MVELTKAGFNQHLILSGLSARTVDLYMSLAEKIDNFFADTPPFESSDMIEMLKFQKKINTLVAQFLVDHKREYYWAVVKYYCEYKYDIIVTRPRHFVEPDVVPKNIGDYQKIIDAIEIVIPKTTGENKIIFTLHKFYGKRITEILTLKVNKVNFEDSSIEWDLKRNKKSKKKMTPDIALQLRAWIKENDLLGADDLFYPCREESHMKAKSKYNRFIRGLKKIEGCPEALTLAKTHDVRRAIATQICLQNDVETAGAWLDHSSMDTLKYKGELANLQSNQKAYITMEKVSRGEGIITPKDGPKKEDSNKNKPDGAKNG